MSDLGFQGNHSVYRRSATNSLTFMKIETLCPIFDDHGGVTTSERAPPSSGRARAYTCRPPDICFGIRDCHFFDRGSESNTRCCVLARGDALLLSCVGGCPFSTPHRDLRLFNRGDVSPIETRLGVFVDIAHIPSSRKTRSAWGLNAAS